MKRWASLLIIPLLSACSITAATSNNPNLATQSQPPAPVTTPIEKPPEPPKLKLAETFGIPYPDAVRGIYVTAHSAGGDRFASLIDLLDKTDLNAMVIDIKDDWGNITFKSDDPRWANLSQPIIKDPKAIIAELQKHSIYPIARIVVFKDSVYAKAHPELSFLDGGRVWTNNRGEAFVNPFLPDVWKHNVEIAKQAAEFGFQEIQFDYVRFPEGFEKMDSTLQYSMGDYKDRKPVKFTQLESDYQAAVKDYEMKANSDYQQLEKSAPKAPNLSEKERLVQLRVDAVTDFVSYAKKELEPLGVKMSVDIFGYSATLPEAPGIGQNFSRICENADVISSMIYPSHWGPGYFNIPKPDLEPYRLVNEYSKFENDRLSKLSHKITSRPWIQDFTASWLGGGNYKSYGKAEVEAQIKALQDNGIKEFLLWNAGNSYTNGVDYTP